MKENTDPGTKQLNVLQLLSSNLFLLFVLSSSSSVSVLPTGQRLDEAVCDEGEDSHYQKEPDACNDFHKQHIFLREKKEKYLLSKAGGRIFLKHVVTVK